MFSPFFRRIVCRNARLFYVADRSIIDFWTRDGENQNPRKSTVVDADVDCELCSLASNNCEIVRPVSPISVPEERKQHWLERNDAFRTLTFSFESSFVSLQLTTNENRSMSRDVWLRLVNTTALCHFYFRRSTVGNWNLKRQWGQMFYVFRYDETLIVANFSN